jgi:hypothetical protein
MLKFISRKKFDHRKQLIPHKSLQLSTEAQCHSSKLVDTALSRYGRI